MHFLEPFNDEQRLFLTALPYRVGLWVSQCDHTGGDDAKALELQALDAIVTGFAEDSCKSEFVEGLMYRTVEQRDEWPSWHQGLGDIPGDCRRAIEMLSPFYTRKDISSFKLTVLEIAETVARAYREGGDDSQGGARFSWAELMARLFKRHEPGRYDDDPSISADERTALNAILNALRPDHVEGQTPPDYAAEDAA